MKSSKIKMETTHNNKDVKKPQKEDHDSSDVSSYDDNSDYDNMTSDEISRKGQEKFFKTELTEKIIKYIKIDDSIKEKQKEIREQVKCLKKQKEDMEGYILGYLENVKQDFIKIEGTAKLTKTTSVSKGAIKTDNIKSSVIDGLKKQQINLDNKIIENLLESVLDNVDKNRPTKTKTYIKRTKDKIKDIKKSIKKNKEEDKNNDSDEEIPQYKSK